MNLGYQVTICLLLRAFQILIIIMGSLQGTGRVTVMTVMMMVGSVMAQAGGHYTVVAPDTVRPNTNYLASISVDGTGGDLQVSVGGGGCVSCNWPQGK